MTRKLPSAECVAKEIEAELRKVVPKGNPAAPIIADRKAALERALRPVDSTERRDGIFADVIVGVLNRFLVKRLAAMLKEIEK